MTLVDAIAVRSPARQLPWVRNLILIVGGSFVVALCAQLVVRLPFTPIPVTGQTLGVLLVGAALGARRGAAALALYLAEGAAGLPFFAGGAAGFVYLLGPTGGYLLSFPLAAFITGAAAERGWDRDVLTTAVAMTSGVVVIFALGISWLSFFVGWDRVWVAGLLPFLAGAAIKIAVAAAALPVVWKLVGRGNGQDKNISHQ
jgi:biotin transport system substrate-specific component